MAGVVASGLTFIKQKIGRPRPWNPGSAASSDVATDCGARRSKSVEPSLAKMLSCEPTAAMMLAVAEKTLAPAAGSLCPVAEVLHECVIKVRKDSPDSAQMLTHKWAIP